MVYLVHVMFANVFSILFTCLSNRLLISIYVVMRDNKLFSHKFYFPHILRWAPSSGDRLIILAIHEMTATKSRNHVGVKPCPVFLRVCVSVKVVSKGGLSKGCLLLCSFHLFLFSIILYFIQ